MVQINQKIINKWKNERKNVFDHISREKIKYQTCKLRELTIWTFLTYNQLFKSVEIWICISRNEGHKTKGTNEIILFCVL